MEMIITLIVIIAIILLFVAFILGIAEDKIKKSNYDLRTAASDIVSISVLLMYISAILIFIIY